MRERIEAAFGAWGRFVAEHAGLVAVLTLIATAAFATQLQHFRLDTSLESYFHDDDPVRQQYDAFRDLFGRESLIVVALKPEGGVFQADFLERLRALHEEIEEEVPLIVEVTSLINARETLGTEDGLDVDDFLADWPQTEAEVEAVRARALANNLYRNLVISENGEVTLLAIETEAYLPTEDDDLLDGFDDDGAAGEAPPQTLLTGDDDVRITKALQAVLERYESDDLEIYMSGIAAFNAVLSEKIGFDMAIFTGLSVALIALFLGLLFRRTAAVVLPIVTVSLSVMSTLAFMASLDIPLMPPTQSIPSFLLAHTRRQARYALPSAAQPSGTTFLCGTNTSRRSTRAWFPKRSIPMLGRRCRASTLKTSPITEPRLTAPSASPSTGPRCATRFGPRRWTSSIAPSTTHV